MLKCYCKILSKKHSTILKHVQMDLDYILCLNSKLVTPNQMEEKQHFIYLNCKFSIFQMVKKKKNQQFKLITTTLLFSKWF